MERPRHLRHLQGEAAHRKLQHLVNPWVKGDEGDRRRDPHDAGGATVWDFFFPEGKKGEKRRGGGDGLVKFLS